MFGTWNIKGNFRRGHVKRLLYTLSHMGPNYDVELLTFVMANDLLVAKKCIRTNGLDKVTMIDQGCVERVKFSRQDCEHYIAQFETAYNKPSGILRERSLKVCMEASSFRYLQSVKLMNCR